MCLLAQVEDAEAALQSPELACAKAALCSLTAPRMQPFMRALLLLGMAAEEPIGFVDVLLLHKDQLAATTALPELEETAKQLLEAAVPDVHRLTDAVTIIRNIGALPVTPALPGARDRNGRSYAELDGELLASLE